MTAVLVALALAAVGFAAGWKARGQRDETRALDAQLLAVKADVYRESGERLYDQLQALNQAVTPELTRLQRLYVGWRDVALHGRDTT